jgi:hypothetical protein
MKDDLESNNKQLATELNMVRKINEDLTAKLK